MERRYNNLVLEFLVDRDRRIPFVIVAPIDPFYSPVNVEQLQKADQQIKNGMTVVKTMEELEAMERE